MQICPMDHHLFPGRPVQDTVSIILRHAERDPITDMAHALEVRLTDSGKFAAYSLGTHLAGYGPVNLFHSPVMRCLETARSLLEGIKSAEEDALLIGPLNELGGPYITGDWRELVKCVKEHGQPLFIRKWFDNELPSDLIMPLSLAAELHLRLIYTQLCSERSAINITHDWNIMVLREHYFNLRHEDLGEPGYLDGFCAYLEAGKIVLTYHEHSAAISPPLSD